jgi:patatin-like phospholipase/acyl hydrolase
MMKKILSIDGGGIRGLIPALVLAEIETRTGRAAASDDVDNPTPNLKLNT